MHAWRWLGAADTIFLAVRTSAVVNMEERFALLAGRNLAATMCGLMSVQSKDWLAQNAEDYGTPQCPGCRNSTNGAVTLGEIDEIKKETENAA